MKEQVLIFLENGSRTHGFYKTVEAELAFEHRGYRFLLHGSDKVGWRVTDALCGAAISRSNYREKAIKKAKNIIENQFDVYIQHSKDALNRRNILYKSRFRYNWAYNKGNQFFRRVANDE